MPSRLEDWDSNATKRPSALSADGRYVAFMSEATNLMVGDTNGKDDIFVFDREKRTLERVSLPTGVAAARDLAGTLDDAVGRRAATRQANGNSQVPSISADGRYVAFDSYADNLVPGDTNGLSDVFVRDRVTNTTERVNVGPGGREADKDSGQAVISADGRYVAYESWATGLVGGRDANDAYDVYVFDRVSRTTERISVTPKGTAGNAASFAPSISADGRFVAFDSTATDLVPGDTNGKYDVFLRDREAGTTTRISVDGDGGQVTGDSALASVSGDGRYVGFHSFARTLVPDDRNGSRDVFVYDRRAKAVTRASVTDAGGDANGVSGAPSLSHDGRRIAFDSLAPNLAEGDHNDTDDIFVRDLTGDGG
jgi:Tol biopolymer transport system component